MDLFSASPDEELRSADISKDDIYFLLCVVLAVDHNLAVVLRYVPDFFLTPSWMKRLKSPSSTEPSTAHSSSLRFSSQLARFIRFRPSPQLGFSPISSSTWPVHLGNPGRSCAGDSHVWAGCLQLLSRFVEIGHGDPYES